MKTGLVALVALVAILTVVGCSGDGGGASKDAFVPGDEASEGPGTNPFFTSGEEEDTADGGAQSNPPEPKATVVAEVKITTNKMKDGLFGKEYEKKLKAKGGSKEYTWSIISGALPKGLALVGFSITGAPEEVGEFSITLSVADANDPTQTDSKSFSFTIREDLVLNVYQIPSGGGHHRNEPVEDFDSQTVAWGEKLLFVVEGHAAKYTWEMSEPEKYVTETEDDSFSVEPKVRDADVIIENLTVTVTDDVGSQPVTATLSSVTFQGDPCNEPLSVTINNTPFNTSESNHITTVAEAPFTIILKVNGGVGPYAVETEYDYNDGFSADGTGCHWSVVDEAGTLVPGPAHCSITESIDSEDGSSVFTLTYEPRWLLGSATWGTLSVSDSCNSKRTVAGNFIVDVEPPAEKVTDINVVLFTGEIHDTGNSTADHGLKSSWMSILFSKQGLNAIGDKEDSDYDYEQNVLNKAVGEAYYSLAECNDVAEESYSDRKCAEPRPVEALNEKGETDVTAIKDISLLWHDHGDSDLDADIHLIIFYTKYRYAIYSDEGTVGNAFDNNVVEHTWRLDHISGSKGMLKDDKGNIWFERGAPNVDAEYDYLLLPSFMFGRALWEAEDEAAGSSGDDCGWDECPLIKAAEGIGSGVKKAAQGTACVATLGIWCP